MQLDHNRYQYTRRRRRRPNAVLITGSVVAVVGLVAAAVLLRVDQTVGAWLRPQHQPTMLELSNAGRYSEVLDAAAAVLSERPLHSQALLFQGIAHFYRAVAESAAEERNVHLDQAVVALRRARLDPQLDAAAEVSYLLGKTYFHKGRYYYDLAIKYLQESLEIGYEGADTHEYLGLAYVRTDAPESGLEHFRLALERRPSDLLYLSIGQVYQRLERYDEALTHLGEAVAATTDRTVEVRARFLLGEILLETERYERARDQFIEILEIAPRSADAHVRLGDAYAGIGDNVRARAEWRRARNLEPEHHGANLRLRA